MVGYKYHEREVIANGVKEFLRIQTRERERERESSTIPVKTSKSRKQ